MRGCIEGGRGFVSWHGLPYYPASVEVLPCCEYCIERTCPTIVTAELWLRANDVLKSHRLTATAHAKHEYLNVAHRASGSETFSATYSTMEILPEFSRR